MLHISICDGNEIDCQKLYMLIRKIAESDHLNFCFKEPFYTTASFYQFLKDGNRLDLVFLDLGMFGDGFYGVEFGQRIQKEFGQGMKIVYLAGKGEYSSERLQRASQSFLQKPIQKPEAEKALEKVLHSQREVNDRFEFVWNGAPHLIWRRDILYFRSEKNRVEIITLLHSYWMYRKLSEVARILSDPNFLRVHQSYLICINAVAEYRYKSLKMINSDTVPISKRYQKTIHCFFLKHMEPQRNGNGIDMTYIVMHDGM